MHSSDPESGLKRGFMGNFWSPNSSLKRLSGTTGAPSGPFVYNILGSPSVWAINGAQRLFIAATTTSESLAYQ